MISYHDLVQSIKDSKAGKLSGFLFLALFILTIFFDGNWSIIVNNNRVNDISNYIWSNKDISLKQGENRLIFTSTGDTVDDIVPNDLCIKVNSDVFIMSIGVYGQYSSGSEILDNKHKAIICIGRPLKDLVIYVNLNQTPTFFEAIATTSQLIPSSLYIEKQTGSSSETIQESIERENRESNPK